MKHRVAPYLFVLPNVAIVVLMAVYPLFYNLYLSTQNFVPGQQNFIGLANYARLLTDEALRQSIYNNIIYMVGAVPLTIVVSLGVALALNERIPFRTGFRSIYFLPYLFSWSVVGIIWRWIYSSSYGILNMFLQAIGLPGQPWLLSPKLVMPAIIVASVWSSLGYYMVIYLAGLQSIPSSLYDAAKIDGANTWARFRHITLPSLRPITFMVVMLAVMHSFRIFEQILVMTGGGPARASFVVVLYQYTTGLVEMNVGYGAAIATMLFVMMLGVTLLQIRVFRYGDDQ